MASCLPVGGTQNSSSCLPITCRFLVELRELLANDAYWLLTYRLPVGNTVFAAESKNTPTRHIRKYRKCPPGNSANDMRKEAICDSNQSSSCGRSLSRKKTWKLIEPVSRSSKRYPSGILLKR